ncbi:MAG: hypothetical protein IT236_08795, partial [Bacteroidia bacterium]|nr:hypothetical protein [Bacteroidia bacterium]
MQNSTTHNLQRFAVFFVKKLRLGNPWNYKAPLLITFPYLIFLFSNYQSGQAFFAVLAACVVIIGVAGVGYLSNDLGDRKKDKQP